MNKKTVLITGASRGIGRGIAEKYISKGHNVILVCKNDTSRMNALKQLADDNNSTCIMYSCDISSYEDIEKMFKDIDSKGISIDIVINNAGISHVGLLQDMTVKQWQDTIDTNLSSIFYICTGYSPNGRNVNNFSFAGIYH